MAFITVGLDTSRTYNKKQPLGGACADLFGGDTDTQQGQQKKLNRMLSNVELGSDQEVIKEKKNEKVPEVAQTRIQKKSQPSVCPVTGETLGHNTAAKESVVKPEKKTKSNDRREEKEVKAIADEKKEAKIVSVGEPAPPNAVTESKESVAATKSEASQPSAPPPAQTDTATASATTETSPSVIPSTPASTSAPAPHPAPAPTPAHISAPAVDTTPSPPPAPTSAPAPMKARRVPPGGHTTAFW